MATGSVSDFGGSSDIQAVRWPMNRVTEQLAAIANDAHLGHHLCTHLVQPDSSESLSARQQRPAASRWASAKGSTQASEPLGLPYLLLALSGRSQSMPIRPETTANGLPYSSKWPP